MNKEISATEAFNLRKDNSEAVFLDVREDSELAICRINGALHIPMGQIPERYESLPKEVPLVVFCHHGMRSMHVLQYLEAKGFENAMNLKGGIHAWANDVDQNVTKY
ncbi:MAG: rhodanese [Verrucomicrobia bacterium]|jgi:rhodanese-related sulfurtransferase|nr:rhodanese [Verrucomicrobiota bacterium]